MAVTKIRKMSSWMLTGVIIISVIVLAMFYLGGVVDPAAENKEPVNTSLLLYWCYVLFGVTMVCLVLFGIMQFFSSLKTKPKAALGSLVVLVAFVILMGVSYAVGDPTPLPGINSDSEQFNTPRWLKISDMWIYSTYILLGFSVLAMIAGSLKKVLNK